MKHHRFADIFALLQGKEFDDLKADIAANGQRLPILTYDGEILDGRNRERACLELGVTPRYEESSAKSENEAIDLVVSLNLKRRHMTDGQVIAAAAELMTMKHGGDRRSTYSKTTLNTSEDLAKRFDVHEVSIRTAKRVKDRSPKLFGMVKAGTLGVNDAATAIRAGAAAAETPQIAKEAAKTLRDKRGYNKPKPAAPSRARKTTSYAVPAPAGYQGPPKFATEEEHQRWVDPEFTGTPIEWTDKYGHVQTQTAEQYATDRFGAWTQNIRSLARAAKECPDWPKVDQNWLRNPKASDIVKMEEALSLLEPKISEARAQLDRAKRALEKGQAPDQPVAVSLLTE